MACRLLRSHAVSRYLPGCSSQYHHRHGMFSGRPSSPHTFQQASHACNCADSLACTPHGQRCGSALTWPPHPSSAFTMDACACTSYTGLAVFSRSHICSCPPKLPVANLRSITLDAPKVPHLKLLGFCAGSGWDGKGSLWAGVDTASNSSPDLMGLLLEQRHN